VLDYFSRVDARVIYLRDGGSFFCFAGVSILGFLLPGLLFMARELLLRVDVTASD